MGNIKKTLDKILGGGSDANILFNDICNLLTHLGFDIRIRGSHHIFKRIDIEEIINLQKMAIKQSLTRFGRYVILF